MSKGFSSRQARSGIYAGLSNAEIFGESCILCTSVLKVNKKAGAQFSKHVSKDRVTKKNISSCFSKGEPIKQADSQQVNYQKSFTLLTDHHDSYVTTNIAATQCHRG